ncbi:MAG: hypothetical protein AUK26_13045 [Syntrophaceae bacterium CG2_30_58_14]|nr:MAG: hypothetical protein AUK26_13045 [Syntrophaceae bacterium CG2_30_58_14]
MPVAERREKARKQAEKLRKKGKTLAPVVIAGRSIAATFWGKAWCENLERYGDYENRIPRGRAYVRNGSVVDLQIGTARVDAQVSGSHLYSVEIEIRSLKAEIWKGVKGACMGRIGSLLELLQGKLSREVMEIVTRPRTGLFPEPAEISFRCSCPDWASMCKHVAAVLYGVGARLDREPELLFRLRDVDHRELIAAPGAADLAASPATREKLIADEDLAGIFGIEIDERPALETPKRDKGAEIRTVVAEPAALKRGRKPILAAPTETPEPARLRRGRPPKPADSAETPEPPKRKRGRPRLAPKAEAPIKPRRGRPPLVPTKTPLPWKQQAGVPAETPEPLKRKRGRPRLTPKAEAVDKKAPPLPDRLEWDRRPKPPAPTETPEPVKRKRGRPRLTPKTGSAGQAAPLPEEPKRERPKLRPAFVRALREEAAPIPTRRRGRPPGKRKA